MNKKWERVVPSVLSVLYVGEIMFTFRSFTVRLYRFTSLPSSCLTGSLY